MDMFMLVEPDEDKVLDCIPLVCVCHLVSPSTRCWHASAASEVASVATALPTTLRLLQQLNLMADAHSDR